MSTSTVTPRPTAPAGAVLLWLTLASVLCVLLVSLLDPALAWPLALDSGQSWYVAALNALPLVLVMLLLFALTRRAVLSGWLTLLLALALYAANAAKLEQLEMPLLPGDFRFLGDLGAALPLFSHYIAGGGKPVLLGLGVLALTLVLTRERAANLRWLPRLGLAAGTLALGAAVIAGTAPARRVYDAQRLQFEPWSVVDSASRAGLLGNLVLYQWELASRQQLLPDRIAASDLLRAHQTAVQERLDRAANRAGNADLPDIVIVQSESLFDPARLAGAERMNFLPNYHRLAKRGLAGELRVPTFAGGTIRTEFEVLTGMALGFFPGVQYPYFEIADRPLPGIVRTLARSGYRSTAVHPNAGAFWNRSEAYKQIGFDRFVDGREFAEADKVSLFTGDAALTDRILSELDDDGAPQLLFAVSMENHGPFDWRPGLDAARLAALKVPPGLDEGGDYWIRNYLYLLQDADHELGRLADALQKRKRHTLLLFYGDHLPALPPVYHQLGFADGRGPKEQPVPWLLLDNRQNFRRAPMAQTTAWLLPSLLLDVAGIGGDPYFALLSTIRTDTEMAAAVREGGIGAGITALGQLQYRDEFGGVAASALAPGEDPLITATAP